MKNDRKINIVEPKMAVKMDQGGPKTNPRVAKSGLREAQGCPRAVKSGQEWPKISQKQPKSGPRADKSAQELP